MHRMVQCKISQICNHLLAILVFHQLKAVSSFYEPEDYRLNTPELLTKYGYPVEQHHVITPDGYILTHYRISHGRNRTNTTSTKGTVLLVHGICLTSDIFVLAGPNRALGYILADAGYDVWLANVRGTPYSQNHTVLSAMHRPYWNFSWHEIGVSDLSATVDYILKYTSEEALYYIGYSQGTSAFFVLTSVYPWYNSKIRASFHMAPITFLNHMISPIFRLLATVSDVLYRFVNNVGLYDLPPFSAAVRHLARLVCSATVLGEFLYKAMLDMVVGFNVDEMDLPLMPIYAAHFPVSIAAKQLFHYAQFIRQAEPKFQNFDYQNRTENLAHYGVETPPSYRLDLVTAPVYLFCSNNDWLSTMKDVDLLYDRLPMNIVKQKVIVDDSLFNHADYTIGRKAPDLVYRRILKLMQIH